MSTRWSLENRRPKPAKGLIRLKSGITGLLLNTHPLIAIVVATEAAITIAANAELATRPTSVMSISRFTSISG